MPKPREASRNFLLNPVTVAFETTEVELALVFAALDVAAENPTRSFFEQRVLHSLLAECTPMLLGSC